MIIKRLSVNRVAIRLSSLVSRLSSLVSRLLALAGFAVAAHAETVITSHAITTFDDPPKYAADFTHLDYVNPDAPKGGEISIWRSGGFDSMNPYSVKGRAPLVVLKSYEKILTKISDEIGTRYCLLCSTMEYPKDRSWVVFNLRPEVTFADGSPMTANDVVFSFNLFLEKGLPDLRVLLGQQVDKVEALDPHRVKFTFKPGVPTRDLPASIGELTVLSKAQYEKEALDLEQSSMKPFLGTGPYVLDKLDISKSITFKLNPNYWGKDLPIKKGYDNFDRIRVEYYGDYQAAFEGFKAGNYTFRQEGSSIIWATGYDFPAVVSGQVIKTELPSGVKASGQSFLFNLRKEKFQDPRVREAIGMMFNFEWSNQTLFYGLYERINSVWENTDMAATGVPSSEEVAILQPLVDDGILPVSILTDDAVLAPVSGERQLDRKNLRAASALLDKAGWKVGDDGMRRNAKGEVLKVEFLKDSPSVDRVITPFVENLKALGIDAYMTAIDNAQMESRIRPPSYDFDIIIGFALSDYISGPDLKQYYASEFSDVSAFNPMGLKSSAVDRLIDVVMAAESNEKMKVATRALDRVLRAERFWVPHWYKSTNMVAYYDMYEHPVKLPPYELGELDFWWYNAEKGEALKAAGVLK